MTTAVNATSTRAAQKSACTLSNSTVIALASIFAWSSSAPAQTVDFSVLYRFTGATDGGTPLGSLIADPVGNLYGVTAAGGDPSCVVTSAPGCGAIFKLSPEGSETVVFDFTRNPAGIYPTGGLKRDSQGNLFGTTEESVFAVSPAGTETLLHAFLPGVRPLAGVVGDAAGNLYGTIFEGRGTGSLGAVFRVAKGGAYSLLHRFQGPPGDGEFPESALIIDSTGNLYGTTSEGGSGLEGTVFKIDAAGNFTILHNFGGTDGQSPSSALTIDSSGNLYGVTVDGGTEGSGVVFKITAAGEYSVLYNFKGGLDGGQPQGKLALTPSWLYAFGTATAGGEYGAGTVFVVNTTTGEEHSLYSFTGFADGNHPDSGIHGKPTAPGTYELFGTTLLGGDMNGCQGNGCGTVFRLVVTPN